MTRAGHDIQGRQASGDSAAETGIPHIEGIVDPDVRLNRTRAISPADSADVAVGTDQAWNNNLALEVETLRGGWDRHLACRSESLDHPGLHQQRPGLDRLTLDRYDFRACERMGNLLRDSGGQLRKDKNQQDRGNFQHSKSTILSRVTKTAGGLSNATAPRSPETQIYRIQPQDPKPKRANQPGTTISRNPA